MRVVAGLLVSLACMAASSASAQTGFYLPTAPTSYGQDEFRAADGTTCRSSMDGTKRVEVGTYASGGQTPIYGGYGYPYSNYYSAPMQGNAGVYGRFTMSLDANSDRMDCRKFFELEMEKRKLEVEILKRSLVAADQQLDTLKTQRSESAPLADGLRGSIGSDTRSGTHGDATAIRSPGTGRTRSSNKEAGERRRAAPL